MELFIEMNYGSGVQDFWLRSSDGEKEVYYAYDGKNTIATTRESAILSDDIKPFLKLDHRISNDFIKLVADYANKNGIKTEKRDFIEGELMATKRHLEDLQKAYNKLLETVK